MALEDESVFCFHLPDWWLTVDIVSSSLVDDSGSSKKKKYIFILFLFHVCVKNEKNGVPK